jgi:DNA-binding transcriptional ArsR family regulator
VTEQQIEKTPHQQLADARAELDELQGLIDGLEEQVREGDETEAQMELGRQYGLKRLASLRREAAERRVARAEEEQRQQRRLEAEAAAQADFEQLGVDRLAAALDTAVRALAELKQLGDARQAAVERHARAYVDLEMTDRIRHRDGGWIVYEVAEQVYDTNQDRCQGDTLVTLAMQEMDRRLVQTPARLQRGYPAPEPFDHPVTRHLAAQAGEGQ